MSFDIYVLIGTFIMLLMAFSVVFFIYLYQKKIIQKNIKYREVESLLQKQELETAYQILEAKDKERKSIAEELHDNLGNILVSLNMYLDTLDDQLTEEKQIKKLERIKEIANKATEETRSLSHRLDAVSLKHFGLGVAIEDLAQTIEQTNSISVNRSILINETNINSEIALNLYRILQELVNNTLKYASASKISIELNQIKADYISFMYMDNGIGFDVDKTKGGMGISNIYSRADKINSEINFNSGSKGTSVNIEIPL